MANAGYWDSALNSLPPRTPKIQEIISRLGKSIMAKYPGTEALISQYIGSSPQFTVAEVRSILSKAAGRVAELADLNGGGRDRKPVLPLYDFCFSIDMAVAALLQDQQAAKSWDEDGSNVSGVMRDRVIPPDFRPIWYHDAGIRLGQVDERGRVMTQGQRAAGDAMIYESHGAPRRQQYIDPAVGGAQGVPIVRPKNPYEKCVEEAYLLGFNSWNQICALSQGLYRQWASVAGGNAGVWVNEPGNVAVGDYSAGGTALYQPKFTDLREYPENRYMRETLAHGIPTWSVLPGGAVVGALSTRVCGSGAAGGSWAGSWAGNSAMVYPVLGAVGFAPRTMAAFGTYVVHIDGAAAGSIIAGNAPAATRALADSANPAFAGTETCLVPSRAYVVKLSDAWAAMRAQNGAIRFCPDFADQMRKLKLDRALLNIYEATQSLLWGSIKRGAVRLANPLDVAAVSARGGCPPGAVVTYQTTGRDSKLLVGDAAFVNTPQGKVLRRDVDPASRECSSGADFDTGDVPSFSAMCLKDLPGWDSSAGMQAKRRKRRSSKSRSRSRSRSRKGRSRSGSRKRRRSRSSSRRRRSRSRSRMRADTVESEKKEEGEEEMEAKNRKRKRRRHRRKKASAGKRKRSHSRSRSRSRSRKSGRRKRRSRK